MKILLLAFSILGTTLVAAEMSGVWNVEMNPDLFGERSTLPCTFATDGEKLSGQCGDDRLTGSVQGRNATWEVVNEPLGSDIRRVFHFTGTFNDTESVVSGTWRFGDREGAFTARKP